MNTPPACLYEMKNRGTLSANRKSTRTPSERCGEADLIDELHREGVVLLSLVAELDSEIVGHILFSRMTVETAQTSVPAVSLAPMAVLPDHQGRQVGSQLVRHGLAELRERGERIGHTCLEHKGYYPRFGFTSGKARYLASPFPPEAFMALELAEGALDDIRGTVQYPKAFGL